MPKLRVSEVEKKDLAFQAMIAKNMVLQGIGKCELAQA